MGGDDHDVSMMVGIGLDKESDAVYFKYMGDNQKPQPLLKPQSGRPLTRLSNVTLVSLEIRENIGSMNSTKLNAVIKASDGTQLMLTSGIDSLWSKGLIVALVALFQTHQVSTAFNLDTWRGTSKMRPCFAGIRVGDAKFKDQQLDDQLYDAYTDKDDDRRTKLLTDAVTGIQMLLKGDAPVDVTATTETLPDDCPV